MPIYVQQPIDALLSRCLYNGKYNSCIYKWLFGIDFLGRIVFSSGTSFYCSTTGPHLGTIYDGHIYQNTEHLRPLNPWELHLGDGHFSHLPHVIGPYKKPRNGEFSAQQKLTNQIISHYRSRVEHINRRFNCHAVFHSKWRGGVELLSNIAHITANTTNIVLHWRIAYPPVGPWPHFLENE